MKSTFRIKKNQDFANAIKNGKAYRSHTYTSHVIENQFGFTRIGLSVSAKLGNAVVRNKIKRQVRAILRSTINFNSNCLDIVIIVKPRFLENSFKENSEALHNLLFLQIGLKQ